jgi:hypothetical protein
MESPQRFPEEIIPEAAANHEEVLDAEVGAEDATWPVAHQQRDCVEHLRILYAREVSAETR